MATSLSGPEPASNHIANAQQIIRNAAYILRQLESAASDLSELVQDLEAADQRLNVARHVMTHVIPFPTDSEVDHLAMTLSRVPADQWGEVLLAERTYWLRAAREELSLLRELRLSSL